MATVEEIKVQLAAVWVFLWEAVSWKQMTLSVAKHLSLSVSAYIQMQEGKKENPVHEAPNNK